MKLYKGAITILVSEEGTTIEIHDKADMRTFVKVKMTPKQLSQALSRLGYTPVEDVEVFGLEYLNKKRVNSMVEIHIPKSVEYKDKESYAIAKAQKLAPKGWTVSTYLGSKSNWFYGDGGNYYARVNIYKYEDMSEEEIEDLKKGRY